MADKDVILVEYQGKINDLEKKLDKLENDMLGVDAASKKSMGTIDKESKKAATSVNKVDKEVTGLKNKLSDLAGRIPGVFAVQEVLSFGNSVNTVTTKTEGATAAMRVLKIATYSALGVFIALAVPILAIIAYFKRTDEGATKLEGVMGALGAATNEVTGFIAELGSKVYDAMQSFEDFKTLVIDAATNIGKYIFNRIAAPIILVIDLFKLAKKGFTEGFDGLGTEFADALLRFTTGFENLATNTGKFADRIAKAAKEAYEFALAMDAISDAQRDLNVELSENEKRIVELIRQSKNHSRSEEERKSLLKEANALEESGLNKQLDLENQKLKLIQERNKRESDSINQQLNADLALAKTDAERFKLKQKTLSINDDLAQEEADQIIKINNIEKASIALKERNLNSIAALDEEILQNHLSNIKATGIAEENIYKEQYANQLISEQELQDGLVKAQIDSLQTQKEFLQAHGRETVEIDKAIQDLQVKQTQESDKEKLKAFEDAQKEYADSAKTAADQAAEERAERDKKEIEAEKKKQEQKKQILAEAMNIAGDLLNGFNQRQLDKDNAEIESERSKNNAETDSLIANLEKRKEAGLLSETSFAAQKEAIQKRAAKKEADLKRKAFEAQKRADLTQILINTALSITKAFATLPYPANLIAAAASAAEGAIQYAFVSSKPTPKFKEGGEVKGKSHNQGGVHIEAEGGEYITKVSQTKKYKGLLESINNDTVDKYLTKDYLTPLLKKQQLEHEKELRKREAALHLAVAGNDMSHLERLTKRNKSVSIENGKEFAKILANEIRSNYNPRLR